MFQTFTFQYLYIYIYQFTLCIRHYICSSEQDTKKKNSLHIMSLMVNIYVGNKERESVICIN